MTSFMGPMAPPPAAPAQPQALDIRTDPNQRQQFKQFMKRRTATMPMQQQPPMQPLMMQPPMPMMQSPAMFNMGGGVDIFDPMYSAPMMAPSAPMGFDDGGAVPPRRTDIRGQDHMLSYITPDEADILQALGGSGEAGPMGIPAFPPGFGGEESGFGSERAGGAAGGPSGAGGSSGGNDGGSDADEEGDASQVGDMFDSYESDSDADEQGDAIVEQAVIDQIVSDNDSSNAINQAIQNAMSSGSDRVGAGFVDPANVGNVGTGPTPEVNLTATSASPQTSFNVADRLGTGIASTVNTGSRDTRGPDAGRTDLLGLDDLLADQFTERGLVTDADPRSNQVVLGGGTDNMNLVNTSLNDLVDIGAAGLGVNPNPNIPDMAMGTPNPNVNMLDDSDGTTTTPAQDVLGMEDEYFDEDIAAGFGPGGGGLDTFASRQQRAADYAKDMGYDLTDRSVSKRGAERGFGGITDQQRADLEKRAAESIFGDSFLNNPRNINNILEDNRATGIYTNPDGTVRGVTGLPDPDAFGGLMQSGVNFLGGFMPNFIGETYTGTGANPFDGGEDPGGSGGDGPDQRVKPPTDPCPDGFVMKNGACTPIDTGETPPNQIGGGTPPAYVAPPVIVPSTRQAPAFTGQGPVGYGSPIAGQAAPSVATNAAMYQQMLNQQAMNPPQFMPIRLQQGGAVSSNLDMAADNFLKALMPAA